MRTSTIFMLITTLILIGIRYFKGYDFGKNSGRYDDNFSLNGFRRAPLKPKNLSDEDNVEKFSRIIEKYPTDASAYCNRSAAYIRLKQYDKALIDLNKAIELQPAYADAFNNRGIVYYHTDYFEQAINDFTTAIFHVSEDGTYYLNRGMCYKKTDNLVQAESDFDRAIEFDRGFIEKAYTANSERNVLPTETIVNKERARIAFLNIDILFVKCERHIYSDGLT